MTSPLRGLSRDFAIYGLGEVLVKAFALITLPLYTRVFTPDEFGVFSFVVTIGGLLSSALLLGGDSAYARFFFEARTLTERRTITTTWIAFLALWSALICLALLPLSRTISEASFGDARATDLVVLTLLTGPIALINRMCAQVLRNQFRAVAFTALNVVSTALLIAMVVIAVVGLQLGLAGILIGTLAAELVMLPVRLWTARSMFGPTLSRGVLGKLLAFGVPLVPTSLAYWLFLTSDRLILGKLSTLEQLGLYSVANSVVNLGTIAISAFGQAWSPHAVALYENDRDAAPAVFGRVMTYLLGGFGLLAVGVSAFGSEILNALTGPEFHAAAPAIAPLALGLVAMATTQVTAGGISLAKRTHYLATFAWLAALANVGLNLLLDGPFGMVGAAWATAIAYLLLTLLYLGASQRLWAVAYEVRRGLALVALTVGFVLAAAMLPDGPYPLVLFVKAAYCGAFAIACVAIRAIDRREIDEVRRLVAAIRG